METVVLGIERMAYRHCVQRIRAALAGLPGLTGVVVGIGMATLQRDPRQVSDDDLVAAVASAGSTVTGRLAEERVP